MTIERTRTRRRGAAHGIKLCLVTLVTFGTLTAAAPYTSTPAPSTPTASSGPSAVHYPVPDGALFVSPTGSDRASGAPDAPLRTVAAAVRAVQHGGTVVLRAGTYRESAGVVRRRVTIQPYPGEQVWLKGSVVIGDWTRAGSRWTHSGWAPRLCARDCFLPAIIDPAYPMAGRPEMAFVDGKPLRQVPERAEVRSGTFHADPATRTLVLGDDPAGHLVEVTAHEQLLRFDGPRAAGSVLRGVRVAHYGSRQHYGAHGAMVVVNAPRVRISDVAFSWSAAAGLAVFQPDVVVRRSVLEHNGLVGLVANRADRLRLIGNRFAGNNAEHFTLRGPAIGAAGAKITRTRRPYVAHNAFTGNHATGWWCDLGCTDATVIGTWRPATPGTGCTTRCPRAR